MNICHVCLGRPGKGLESPGVMYAAFVTAGKHMPQHMVAVRELFPSVSSGYTASVFTH